MGHNRNYNVHYEIFGEGFPIVFLHGLGTDNHAMQAWVEPIFINRTGWQRIYIDLPGHGRSKVDEWVTTSDDLLSITLNALDAIVPNKQFALAAKSFGGYIGQGIFHRKLTQLTGLCLLAPALHKRDRSLPPRVILRRDQEVFKELDQDIATAFDTLMVIQNRDNLQTFLEEVQPGRLLADRAFLTSEWRTKGYFFSFDPFNGDKVYTQPMLMLLGRQDAICGYEDHFEILKLFPNGTVSILDRSGHMLEIEQRVLVQALFNNWLDRIEQNNTKV